MSLSSPPAAEWVLVRRGCSSRSAPLLLGESPCWDPRCNRLLFVDIERGIVHRLDPVTGRSESVTMPKGTLIGAVGLVEACDDTDSDESACWFVSNHGLHLLSWAPPRSTLLLANPDAPDTRFNDAKVCPCGDLVAGTIVTESNAEKRRGRGHIFRLTAQPFADLGGANHLRSEMLLSGATLSNGLDFETNAATGEQRLWWIDSAAPKVQCFAMHGLATDAAASSAGPVWLSRLDRCIRTAPSPNDAGAASLSLGGVPDGMTLDVEGCVWIALSGAGIVVRCTPTGDLLRVVRFPVSKVTSVCFGGSNMRTLFVTSAAKGVDLSKEPLAGSVFSVPDAGVAGRPMHRLRGRFTLAASSPTEVVQHRLVEDIAAAPRSKL